MWVSFEERRSQRPKKMKEEVESTTSSSSCGPHRTVVQHRRVGLPTQAEVAVPARALEAAAVGLEQRPGSTADLPRGSAAAVACVEPAVVAEDAVAAAAVVAGPVVAAVAEPTSAAGDSAGSSSDSAGSSKAAATVYSVLPLAETHSTEEDTHRDPAAAAVDLLLLHTPSSAGGACQSC